VAAAAAFCLPNGFIDPATPLAHFAVPIEVYPSMW
jgi:hypothetical protein